MRYNRKLNILVITILLGVIFCFAYNYNAHVRSVFSEAGESSRDTVRGYNSEIIGILVGYENTEDWQKIAEGYDELAIEVENSDNVIVVQHVGKSFKEPAIRVSTPFVYNGQGYILKTSMYVFRNLLEGISGAVTNFALIQFVLGVVSFVLIMYAIYIFMLKNYKHLYEVIEEYEKTGVLKKANLKGYAGHIYRRFGSMTENLERQRKNQQHIIASISHDIKTPLTSIMGYAERLGKDNISEERREKYLGTVYSKSLEIKELLNEFDEYSGLNASGENEKTIINGESLATRLSRDFGDDLEFLGVTFNINNEAADAEICVEINRMKRVFSNIFGNSVKHFKDDSKIIGVDITCDKEKLYVEVSDNGKGVAQEDLEIIFEPLYTSDEGRKVSGLGLAICREIVNSHGGKIYAKKSELGGLAICIELDRCDVTQYL